MAHEGADARQDAVEAAGAEAVAAAFGEKGAKVGRRQGGEVAGLGRAAVVAREKADELTHVPLVGVDRQAAGVALDAEPVEPGGLQLEERGGGGNQKGL